MNTRTRLGKLRRCAYSNDTGIGSAGYRGSTSTNGCPDQSQSREACGVIGVRRVHEMIAALVSDEDRWINAQRIEVSGGMGL
jgi:hypothetical protein